MGVRKKPMLAKRAAIAALAGVMPADEVCKKFKLKPRWRLPPVAWGRRRAT